MNSKIYLEILCRIRFTQVKIKDCNGTGPFPHMTPVFDYLFRKSSPSFKLRIIPILIEVIFTAGVWRVVRLSMHQILIICFENRLQVK